MSWERTARYFFNPNNASCTSSGWVSWCVSPVLMSRIHSWDSPFSLHVYTVTRHTSVDNFLSIILVIFISSLHIANKNKTEPVNARCSRVGHTRGSSTKGRDIFSANTQRFHSPKTNSGEIRAVCIKKKKRKRGKKTRDFFKFSRRNRRGLCRWLCNGRYASWHYSWQDGVTIRRAYFCHFVQREGRSESYRSKWIQVSATQAGYGVREQKDGYQSWLARAGRWPWGRCSKLMKQFERKTTQGNNIRTLGRRSKARQRYRQKKRKWKNIYT